jgi:hypothetical protein
MPPPAVRASLAGAQGQSGAEVRNAQYCTVALPHAGGEVR